MENLIKVVVLSFLLGSFSSVFAISEEAKSKSLAKILMDTATSSEQKAGISKYFTKLADSKLMQAKKLRESAIVARGGKAIAQNLQKKKMLSKADSLESQAKTYENLAASIGITEFLASN